MKLTQFLEAVRARLAVDADRWKVDVDEVAEHAATSPAFQVPRYVWVPTRDRFGPAERAGGNPHQLYTREAGVELHLWAETVDDAETRMLAVIGAMHAEGATSVMFDAANWSGPSIIGRGVLLTLECRVKLPVTRAAQPTAQATTIEPDTAGAAQDGVLQWGETT